MSSLFVFYDIKKDVGNLTLNLKDSLSHSRMELRNGMNVPHHPLPWIYILTHTILFLPNFQIPLPTCFYASLSHISQSRFRKAFLIQEESTAVFSLGSSGVSEQGAKHGLWDWTNLFSSLVLPATGL